MIPLAKHLSECKKQNRLLVRDFISAGLINLDALNNQGLNPLHVTVKKEKPSLTELLLENGAQVDAKTKTGETALSLAITQILPGTVKILLDHKASLVFVKRCGRSALGLVTELGQKFHGQLEKRIQIFQIFNMIVEHGINSADTNQSNYYRLCKALIIGDLTSARRMVRFSEDVNFSSVKGESPLEFAAYFYRLELVEMLLKKGANPNQDLGLNRESALVYAINKGSFKMVKLLLDFGAEVNFTSSFCGIYEKPGRTPLFRAAQSSDLQFGIVVMEELLSHGAKVSGLTDDTETAENTALHAACHAGFAEAVKLLLRHSAMVNCLNNKLETPLHQAVEFPEIVKILLDSGAEVNARSLDGSTPLHRACSIGCEAEVESVRLLIDSGADLNATDFDLETPLHYACRLCDSVECIKLLVDSGANIMATDIHGKTILHCVAENYKVSNLKYVIDLVVCSDLIDINARDKNGNTPLHFVYDDSVTTCNMFVELLKMGADHNIPSKCEDYPFHECWEDLDESQCPADEFMQRLLAIGYIGVINYDFFGENLSEPYQRELEELKTQTIVWNPRTSLNDLLFMKRHFLERYAGNENLKQAFEECGGDFETKYPYYGSLLNVQYRRSLQRKKLTSEAAEYLTNVVGRRMPEICVSMILKYLSNSDIRSF